MSQIYMQSIYEAYPDFEHGHMFPCKITAPADYSKDYEFRVTSKWRKFQRFWVEWILFIFGPVLTYFRFGPKYKNKHILKKYKNELKNGFMTISNHCFPWDNVVLRNVHKFHRVEMPIWKEGAESSNGKMFRLAGGITVPSDTIGIAKSFAAMKEVIKEKRWLHVYPEAACWEFYSPIREFKSGTFRLAVDYDVPVFPVAFSFRKATGLFKLWKGKRPLVNVNVGEPLYADKNLERQSAINDLCKRVHDAVIKLAGFDTSEENEEFKKNYKYYPYVNPYEKEYEKYYKKHIK